MIRIKAISALAEMGPRSNQEDYIIIDSNVDNPRIFVLCDGMGGHGHGEVASKTVAEAVFNYLKELNCNDYSPENLQDAVDFGLDALKAADIFGNDEKAPGTTIVIVVLNSKSVLVGHIGDSRCYQFSVDGNKKFRSKDHSKVQEAVDAEILTEEEAFENPYKNILTRCITSKQVSVQIEIDELYIENNDYLLICSDGVTDALRDSQLQSIFVERPIEEVTDIIKSECELSSHDNFSLILISLYQDDNSNTNQALKINNDSYSQEHITTSEIKLCRNCGKEMPKTALFCPNCGTSCITESVKEKDKGFQLNKINQKLKSYVKAPNPLWTIGYTIIIGAVFCAISFFLYNFLHKHNPETTTTGTEDLNMEKEFDEFIAEICSTDSLGSSNDSVISKSLILDKYQSFIEKIQKDKKNK